MKKLAFTAVALVLVLLGIEVGARLLFAARVGPSVLLYGTPLAREDAPDPLRGSEDPDTALARRVRENKHTVMVHANQQRHYSKYFPNQRRIDYDRESGESFEVGINSRGFRGEEFTTFKAPGVVRIVTLGASSTFGYYSRDDQTYPAQLEKQLGERCADNQRYEVINLGIPHLDSGNIAALFLAEGIALDPDVVTFYEGVNDTSAMKARLRLARAARPTALERGWDRALTVAARHSIVVGFARSLRDRRADPFIQADFERNVREVSERFLANLEYLRLACQRAGIELIVASQQATSTTLSAEELESTPYAREAALVRERALESGQASTAELRLISHAVLMRDLEAWAREKGVAWVDVIAALDEHREALLSWVHLSPRGNQIVASVLAEEILARTCTKVLPARVER